MATELVSNAKLEPFLLMSKSAKGAAAAKLVQDATSAPGVFVFAELLELPNIQELSNGEHAQFFSLLQLFSYRTFEDYVNHRDLLPALNAAQTTKLKHLSLISLAMDCRVLSYAHLLQALQMQTIRELEDLIIDAIYLDLVRGKLDQKKQQFEVEYTLGRDIEPGKIESLLFALQSWANTTASVLTTLDTKISSIGSQRAATKAHLDEHERAFAATLKDLASRSKEARDNVARKGPGLAAMGRANSGHDDLMDTDEPVSRDDIKGKSRKPPSSQGDSSKQRSLKRNRY